MKTWPSWATCALFLWLAYVLLVFYHFYITAILQPPTQRVVRDALEVQLPRLYFCPADRGRTRGFRWHAFECRVTYRDSSRTCPVLLRHFRGREPEEFMAADSLEGGECLEFGTHELGLRAEWTAAWNEVTLRAAFWEPDGAASAPNALREVELGYLVDEWQIGHKDTTTDRFYSPLLRVPHFFAAASGLGRGVATRAFLAQDDDRGSNTAGRYWYTYGAVPVAVDNATVPIGRFLGEAPLPSHGGRLGVAHAVLTLEDFQRFEWQVGSSLFPFLRAIGDVAGVGALLALLVLRPWSGRRRRDGGLATSCMSDSDHEAAGHAGNSARYSHTPFAEEHEQQGLLEEGGGQEMASGLLANAPKSEDGL